MVFGVLHKSHINRKLFYLIQITMFLGNQRFKLFLWVFPPG
jgi:hypothetical protein